VKEETEKSIGNMVTNLETVKTNIIALTLLVGQHEI